MTSFMILLSINMNRSLMQWKIFSIFCEYFSDAAILLIFLCFHGVPMTDLPNNSGQNEQAWSFKYSHDEQERREPKLIFLAHSSSPCTQILAWLSIRFSMLPNLTNQYISYSMAVFSANEIRTFLYMYFMPGFLKNDSWFSAMWRRK